MYCYVPGQVEPPLVPRKEIEFPEIAIPLPLPPAEKRKYLHRYGPPLLSLSPTPTLHVVDSTPPPLPQHPPFMYVIEGVIELLLLLEVPAAS